ncbi:MAG: hypothetical protein GF364_03170 [Candidatus Lokiarchaeota archaeon]|nr:hypothetical protein [Candidatus Lokiarchaeota archaeon]
MNEITYKTLLLVYHINNILNEKNIDLKYMDYPTNNNLVDLYIIPESGSDKKLTVAELIEELKQNQVENIGAEFFCKPGEWANAPFLNAGGYFCLRAESKMKSYLRHWIPHGRFLEKPDDNGNNFVISLDPVNWNGDFPIKTTEVQEMVSNFKIVLEKAMKFAKNTQYLEEFADTFKKSMNIINERKTEDSNVVDNFSSTLMSSEYQAYIAACANADVFFGMGSWLDIYLEGDEKEKYNEVTEDLYQSLHNTIAAIMNSTRSPD